MLVVKIELWPMGSEENKRTLCEGRICNVGGSTKMGNYDFTLGRHDDKMGSWKKGQVNGFPRLDLGAWDLLYRVLRMAVQDRNPAGG